MNEEEFRIWLEKEVETQTPLSSYPNALKEWIPNKLKEIENYDYNNLFDCKDISYLNKLYKRLLNNGDLHQFNINTQSRVPSAAIQKYIKFLKFKLGIEEINTKNIILYGPPGVGKTHNYQNLISMIDEGSKTQLEIFDTIKNNDEKVELNQEIFNKIKDENRVQFITFHQSYSYEDFIEGFRPQEDANIKLEDGVFKNICDDARINQEKSELKEELIFIDALDIILKNKIENEEVLRISLKRKDSYFNIFDYNKRTIFFEKQNGDKSHSLSIKTLEKMYKEETNNIIKGGLAPYYNPLLNELLKIKSNNISEKVEQKNHYLVIDEINRGNISKIFGELITLIEEDKRDIYEVTLPYSKESFKIPSNLYIIATMNSSDKSIATIDIALRRRFTFLNMLPNHKLVKNSDAKELMVKLNTYIKDKIGSDYMLGHSYFMKVQSENDLEFIIEYKIKPLLEEYFYADEKTAEDIIKEAMQYKQKDNSIE